mmetsp:Transcript_111067/g.324889  ORF Transcript_111067/g.324889 Transcript_111067/m.324889 type:complete len:208 (-) Transcript_111067:155-778(-)
MLNHLQPLPARTDKSYWSATNLRTLSTRKATKDRSRSTRSARPSATLPPAGRASASCPARSASQTTRQASMMMSRARKTSYSVLFTIAFSTCCVFVRGWGSLRLSRGARNLENAWSMGVECWSIESLRTQPPLRIEGIERGASALTCMLLTASMDLVLRVLLCLKFHDSFVLFREELATSGDSLDLLGDEAFDLVASCPDVRTLSKT